METIIKPRMDGAIHYLNKKRKQEDLVKLSGLIIEECGTTRTNLFNTLCWLDQNGMLNEKSVTAFLKYKKGK